MEILAYTIPSLIVLGCVWIIMHQMYNNEDQKRLWELKKLSQKEISPLRMRAYERLSLLLERTQPEHLLMDIDISSMTIPQLQQHLLRTVRLEFDHNLSQQIYVSDDVWDLIIQARDQMGAFVASVAAQVPENCTTMEYATALMTAYRNNGTTPHEVALHALKAEAKTLL